MDTSSPLNVTMTEFWLVSSSILILLVYHIHLRLQMHSAPLTTSVGLTRHLRKAWVEVVMKERRDILAVQTMRNWVMAASFLASTSILIDIGLLNVIFGGGHIRTVSHALSLVGSKSEALWLLKMIILIVNFFAGFFNFCLAIRYYNHANFIINLPLGREELVSPDAVAAVLDRANTHYTLGMRAYYLAVPFTLWLFSPVFMFLGTAVMTVILYRLDRTI